MDSNEELVDYLADSGIITSERVAEAFRQTDRANFLPERRRDRAYADTALPIADRATISAPHIVATITELLEIEPDSRVLEIGSGSGYQLGIIARLTDNEVVGVEILPELVEKSRERLEDLEKVRIIEGEGLKAIEGKFDRILYSCAIESLLPAREYLTNGGIAVAPVEQDGSQWLKRMKNGVIEPHARVRFVKYREEP